MTRRETIHLINPLLNATGGSEQRTLSYYRDFAALADVHLWSELSVARPIAASHNVQRITPQSFPLGGTLIFVGCYFVVSDWLRESRPDRVMVVVNTPGIKGVQTFLEGLRAMVTRPLELIYASQWLKDALGQPGVVDFSPIDIERFSPRPGPAHERFRVGRLSRNVIGKHHPDDPALYQMLADSQIDVRLMGAHCLYEANRAQPPAHVQLIPEGGEPPEEFLNSLDCYFYRTHPTWTEPHGRVVTEAMACALPVVCDSRGGYNEFIDNGVNGLLFSGNHEALEMLHYLRHSPRIGRELGLRARQTIDGLLQGRAKFIQDCCRVGGLETSP